MGETASDDSGAYVVRYGVWEWMYVWKKFYLHPSVRPIFLRSVRLTGRGTRRLGDLMSGTCAAAAY